MMQDNNYFPDLPFGGRERVIPSTIPEDLAVRPILAHAFSRLNILDAMATTPVAWREEMYAENDSPIDLIGDMILDLALSSGSHRLLNDSIQPDRRSDLYILGFSSEFYRRNVAPKTTVDLHQITTTEGQSWTFIISQEPNGANAAMIAICNGALVDFRHRNEGEELANDLMMQVMSNLNANPNSGSNFANEFASEIARTAVKAKVSMRLLLPESFR